MSSKAFIRSTRLLRLQKTLIGFIHACLFSELGLKDYKEKNFLPACIHFYYAGFHLSGSALFLIPGYSFDLCKNFLLPDGSNRERVKRYISLTHKKMIDTLAKYEKTHSFISKLSKFLSSYKELRELASYGPYLQLTRQPKVAKDVMIISLRPLYLERDLKITVSLPKPFTPLSEIIEKLKKECEQLLASYPIFFKDQTKGYNWFEVRSSLYLLSLLIPICVVPTVNRKILGNVEKRVRKLVKTLGVKELKV